MFPPVRFRILNIGLDRGLLDSSGQSESQTRQLIYATEIPAEIVHLVKSPRNTNSVTRTLCEGRVTVRAVPVLHWVCFPFATAWVGAKLLKERKFDLIQVQEPLVSGSAGLYLAWRFRLPLVAGAFTDQIANPEWVSKSIVNRLANLAGSFVYRRCDAIRADSLAVMQRLQIGGFLHACFVPFLITNAEQLAQPAAEVEIVRRRLLGGRSGVLLLAVTRLEQEKNLELMLHAVEEVVKSMNDVVLAVIGDGSLREQLQRRFSAEWIRWLGWIPNTELAAYYQAADLSLLSSDIESSARVLTESLLAGTPVLTTDTAGAREVIEDTRSGRIVPVGDRNEFARTLLELCKDSDQLEAMGKYGQRSVSGRMSRANVIAELRQLFVRVVRRHRGEPVVV